MNYLCEKVFDFMAKHNLSFKDLEIFFNIEGQEIMKILKSNEIDEEDENILKINIFIDYIEEKECVA